MVRLATTDDIPAIQTMAMEFGQTTEYQHILTIDPASIQGLAEMLLTTPNALLIVTEGEAGVVGMLAMLVIPSMMSTDVIATEVAWWMSPEVRGDGMKMLKFAEDWAKEQGATVLQMIAPNRRVAQFYTALKFTEIETSFQKRLN